MRYAIDKYKRKNLEFRTCYDSSTISMSEFTDRCPEYLSFISFECISRCIRENVKNNRRTNSANNDMEIIFRILHQSIVAMKKLTIPSLSAFLSYKGSQ